MLLSRSQTLFTFLSVSYQIQIEQEVAFRSPMQIKIALRKAEKGVEIETVRVKEIKYSVKQ